MRKVFMHMRPTSLGRIFVLAVIVLVLLSRESIQATNDEHLSRIARSNGRTLAGCGLMLVALAASPLLLNLETDKGPTIVVGAMVTTTMIIPGLGLWLIGGKKSKSPL